MRPDSAKEAERWLRQAERDLDDARFAFQGQRYNLACFLAQQAAEKAVKAILYARGREQVWGHSVAELCAEAVTYDPEFTDLTSEGSSLDKYYIPTRYPNGLPGGIPADAYREADGTQALASVDKIIATVRTRLPLS